MGCERIGKGHHKFKSCDGDLKDESATPRSIALNIIREAMLMEILSSI